MNEDPNPYRAPLADSPSKTPAKPGETYAPCPACGNTQAKKVSFTWWGGVVGPSMFTHVRCGQCRTTYNGKTGKSNNMAITIYLVVGLVVTLGFVYLMNAF